ncbi:hypothetical protein DFH09DRAFT_1343875 [Mycena vulgaris]|nr:hypothetical protein DFH09DRAFT_1343875 [Mycena vulgaris]
MALSAALEAVQNRRKLQDKDCLATCLDQLSRCFSAEGNMCAGLNSAEEAVRIRRKLAEENGSWDSEAQLAASLSNLACCLSTITSRSEDALHAAQESVSIQRGLARDSPPETFNTRLAIFLHNFSVSLSAVGRHAEALRAADESLQIRTSFGESDNSDCALSLSRLACCLKTVGRQIEAARLAERCLEIIHRLALGEYASELRTETQLAETLFALSFCFPGDQAPQAVEAAADAVAIYRKLRDPGSAAFSAALAGALLQLSSLLLSIGQHEEALRVAVEAVQFGRAHAKDFFSACLYHLSLCFSAAGMQDEGVCPAQQCVELRRELAEEYGTWQSKERLADALFNLSLYFSQSPQSSRALESLREAVDLQRGLAGYLPAERFNERLGDGLQNLSARALLAGEFEEALRSAAEAVEIGRRLVGTDPVQHSPNLVNIVYTYANALCEHARYEEGYRVLAEAEQLRGTISSDSVFASAEAGAAYMSTRARCVAGIGRHDEGLRCLLDGIRLYREAVASEASRTRFESFPWFLRNTFACVSALGGHLTAGVVEAAAEIVEVARLLAEKYPPRFDHCLEEAQEVYARARSGPSA